MGSLLHILFALSPGLLGALAGLLLGRTVERPTSALQVLFAGVGGIAGYLVVATLVWLLNAFGVPIFRVAHLQVMLFLVGFSSLLYVAISTVFGQFSSRPSVGVLWAAPTVILVASCFYQAILTPTASWDGLGLWTSIAHRFVAFDAGRDFGESYTMIHTRHPLLVVNIAAFTGYASRDGGLGLGSLISWWFAWCSTAMVIWGAVREISRSSRLAFAVVFAFCSLPLLENHAILAGYADLWVALITVSGGALIAVGLAGGRLILISSGGICALIPLALKNTGVLYSLALLTPLFLILLGRRFPRPTASFAIISFLLLAWVGSTGFDVKILGNRYALVWGTTNEIMFGGYGMNFELFPLPQIIMNDLWALFINQSFSLIGVIGILSSILLIVHSRSMTGAEIRSLSFLLLAAFCLLLVFMLPQLTTEYAERFAIPGSDLGNSRFLLALGPLILLTLAYWPRAYIPSGTQLN